MFCLSPMRGVLHTTAAPSHLFTVTTAQPTHAHLDRAAQRRGPPGTADALSVANERGYHSAPNTTGASKKRARVSLCQHWSISTSGRDGHETSESVPQGVFCPQEFALLPNFVVFARLHAWRLLCPKSPISSETPSRGRRRADACKNARQHWCSPCSNRRLQLPRRVPPMANVEH